MVSARGRGQARPSLVPSLWVPGPYLVLKHDIFGRQKHDILQIYQIQKILGKLFTVRGGGKNDRMALAINYGVLIYHMPTEEFTSFSQESQHETCD